MRYSVAVDGKVFQSMNTQGTPGRRGTGFLGFFIASGMIMTALILAVVLHSIAPATRRIEVKGYAEEPITSDVAVWRGVISARGAALKSAYDQLARERDQVSAGLIGLGVKSDTLRFLAIGAGPGSAGSRPGAAGGYVLSQGFEVVSNDVNSIDRISKDSMGLVTKGIDFRSFPPQYYYSQLNSKKLDLLGAAARDARSRADQLAQNSGSRVGRLIGASDGLFQVTPLYSGINTTYPVYDTSTIDKSIKATVTVDYSIE